MHCFCFVAAIFDQVHDVEAILPTLTANSMRKSFLKYESHIAIAVSRASLILKKRFQHAVSS